MKRWVFSAYIVLLKRKTWYSHHCKTDIITWMLDVSEVQHWLWFLSGIFMFYGGCLSQIYTFSCPAHTFSWVCPYRNLWAQPDKISIYLSCFFKYTCIYRSVRWATPERHPGQCKCKDKTVSWAEDTLVTYSCGIHSASWWSAPHWNVVVYVFPQNIFTYSQCFSASPTTT